MDELDIRLLRALAQGGHEGLVWGEVGRSYRAIAKSLGVSSETARERAEKMSRSGFLKVFPVQVNPALLGLEVGALSVDAPRAGPKRDLVEKLALVDDMLLIATHVGGLVGLIFYYEDRKTLEKKIKLIGHISGASELKFTEIPYPGCALELKRKDWDIIAALQRGRGKSPGKIAAEVGVSTKTLKRRTKALIDGMAISTVISFDLHALRGAVVGDLMVEYADLRVRREVDRELQRELDASLVFTGLWSSFSLFTLVLPNIPSASEALEKARSTPGVSTARLDLMEDRAEVYSTLSERVQRRLLRGG